MALRRMNPDDFFNAVDEKRLGDMPWYDKYLDARSIAKGSDLEQLCSVCGQPFVRGITQNQKVCYSCIGQRARGTLRLVRQHRYCAVCGAREKYSTRLGYEDKLYLCREHAGGWRARRLAAKTRDID